jgi:MFS transporter, SP family, sugar:H+ symporter
MAIGCMIDVVAAFIVTFVTPYLIQPQYANLASKVGFIFGGFTTLYLVWAAFCLPELKGRSLEEMDELFNAKLWAWQFSAYKTRSLAGQVGAHDGDDESAKKVKTHVENAKEL